MRRDQPDTRKIARAIIAMALAEAEAEAAAQATASRATNGVARSAPDVISTTDDNATDGDSITVATSEAVQ